MKAIHYKGQNKFYLFDKPEEIDFTQKTISERGEILFYNEKLKANLSAGKKIIKYRV